MLRGAAVLGGAVVLGGGLMRPPTAVAASAALPRLGHLSHGYPAALDTGRALVAFGIGKDRQAYHRWWDQGGAWSDWFAVPNSPALKARPIPLLNHNGAMSLFATVQDGTVSTAWQDAPGGGWSWQNLGGPALVEEPFPVLNTDNAMSVFGRGTDGRIHHTYQHGPGGTWAGWETFPADGVGRPWAVIGPTGGMVVFARGANGGVVHRWQSFSGDAFHPTGQWALIPGTNSVNADVTAVVNPTGAITVFAGSEKGVEYTWQKAAAGDWLGEWRAFPEYKILGRPSVVIGPAGGMALFAKRAGATEENQLIHRSQPSWGANWSAWDALDPVTTGEPSGVLGRDGRLSAFGRNKDGKMFHHMQDRPGGLWPIRQTFGKDTDVLEVG